jgi:hypothetical protein
MVEKVYIQNYRLCSYLTLYKRIDTKASLVVRSFF